VLDTAKGVNVVVSEESDDLLKFQGVDRLSRPQRPFVAVPTTAGTGSEVTAAAVIYNEEEHAKIALMSPRLFPDVAIVDPQMTRTMPPRITAATGMDTLTHAIEAYTGLQKNPISDAYAVSAIRLTARYLLPAVEDGEDDEARLGMANAALVAGIAFSNSMVGMVHGLAHACGGVCHVPHGVANGVLLPWGMEYNLARAAPSLADIAGMVDDSVSGSPDARAGQAVAWVRRTLGELNRLCGFPTTLGEAGVDSDHIEPIAKVALNDGAMAYNPEEVSFDEIVQVLNRAL